MSLTSALYTGVSGLSTNGDAMNVIGNNISNVNTVGFKTARSLFSDMLSESRGPNAQVGRGVQLQAVQNMFSQGSSQGSENVSDVSIQGTGFFAVCKSTSDPVEDAYLTRAGAFHTDASGYLVNPDGYYVLDNAGKAIQINNLSRISKIDTDGTISYYDTDDVLHPKDTDTKIVIGVFTVPDTSKLQKEGGSLYKSDTKPSVDSNTQKVLSNSLEQSNVDLASEFVRMIVTQRAYSANSKTITTTDQMTQEVLNLIR